MAGFTEDTINNWRYPPSIYEESKLQTAERLIREAISADPILNAMDITVFGQGSYANDTNVRLNSDIDINVRYNSTFFYQLPNDTAKKEDFGIVSSNYSFSDFKTTVENALVRKFGRADVTNHDKCIQIAGCETRVEADVVPTFAYRRYDTMSSKYIEGVKFYTNAGVERINFPLQHIDNAILKNANTQKRFKRLTRIYRRLRYKMIEDGVRVSDNITSFLLECLVWNVPNNIMNDHDTWSDRLRYSIIHLYNATETDAGCTEWGEVSERLYLFRGNRKWSREDVNNYLIQMWQYLKF